MGELTAAAPRQSVESGALYLVSGHGWGHGVGLSQYGALGFAQRGWTYPRIIGHYYPSTTIGPAPVARVRVLLAGARTSVTIASPVPFKVRDATGEVHDLAAGAQSFGPGFKLKLADAEDKKALPAPLTFLPGGAPLQFGRRYRGTLQVDAVDRRLRVINTVGLEPYLYGVVPAEMPHSWHPEALKAQAVVARSYALAVRRSGAFDLYDDTRSQVYRGVDHEFPESNAAVDATAGQVVLYGGAVATTYFFSTSGGRTASSADVWGGAVPYLVSVPDPYDAISPYHDWGPLAYSGSKLARGLRIAGPILDAQTQVNGSGRVTTLTVTSPRTARSFPGADVRRLLGLRSTWFGVGTLSLRGPSGPVVYGSPAQLAGTARGVDQVELQQRVRSGPWRTVARPRPAQDGTLSLRPRPLAPSDYRLATRSFAAGRIHVDVAPLVRFDPDFQPGRLSGFVRPAFPDSRVLIQLLAGSSWRTVVRATIDASGAFDARLELASGIYRARAVVGRGFVPGTSAVLTVSSG